jgi:hypothetical protein
MNTLKTIILFVAIACSTALFAQEMSAIKGRVTDIETGDALEDASVVLKGVKPANGTTSDYEGYYRLNNVPAGSATVEVQFLGYKPISKTVTVQADKDLVLNIQMEISATELEEVVISRDNFHFKHMELYDGEADVKEERNINGFYALEIYKDQVTEEVWGLGKSPMLEIKKNDDIYYKGTSALEIKWDKLKDHTKWLGFGIGWDQWSGKNIELVQDSCAIQFYMRTYEGTMKNIIIVFHLEDYSGGQTSAVLKDHNFYEGDKLTDEWTKVTIPFSAFTHNREVADLSNVKQLMMQFEVKAHILVDEIEVVKLEPEELARISEEEK